MADKLSLTTFGSLQNDTSATADLNSNSAATIAAVNNTLSRDGTSPNQMGSSLDMNSNRIINLPAPVSNFEPLRLADVTTISGGGSITVNPLPVGGTTGQVLGKHSNANFDTVWQNAGGSSLTTAIFNGSSSGSTTLQAAAIASGTLTLPAATDTLIGKATTDTLTNKTFDTAGTGNVFKIAGTSVTGATGTGSAVLATSPTLTTPTLGAATATSVNGLTVTPSTGTLTIANGKTHAVNNSITMAGVDASTVTFQGTDTYIGKATTDALSNKTFDTAATGNVLRINGTGVSTITGTGNQLVLNTSPILVTPTLGAATGTSLSTTGAVTVFNSTAPPSGGTADTGILMSSLAHLGIYFGTGTPTLSAAQGSLYINIAGSSTSTRMYINTNGATTWTNVVTAA